MPSWKLINHCIRHLVLQEMVQFLNNLQNHNDILYSATEGFEENNSDRFDDTVGERKSIHYRGLRRWKRTMWTKEAWVKEIRICTKRLKRGRNRKKTCQIFTFHIIDWRIVILLKPGTWQVKADEPHSLLATLFKVSDTEAVSSLQRWTSNYSQTHSLLPSQTARYLIAWSTKI